MLKIRRSRGKRGVGFLFFITTMVPVLFVALTLSSDFARLIVTHRQVADTADTVALAGAHAFNNTSGGRVTNAKLNSANANAYAQETFKQALGTGNGDAMLSGASSPKLSSVRVIENGTAIEVTITYQQDGFVALDFLMGGQAKEGFTVTRTAQICSAGTNQYCAYPVG